MYKIITPELRLKATLYYLNNGATLLQTAKKFNVNYRSVFKWVKWYKEKGEERLLSAYKRPWNRTPKELEEKIAMLKEKEPGLTVRKAKEILEKDGIKISIKGIWNIWKRYGYSGFKKNNMWNYWTDYCPWSKEAKQKYKEANFMFKAGKIGESARILNSIPFLPRNELVKKIPDRFLNFRRQVEKTPLLSGEIPFREYLKKMTSLYKEARKRNLNYSAIRIGVLRTIALEWSGKTKDLLESIEELKELLQHTINNNKPRGSYLLFESKFTLLISEGITYATLLRTKEAINVIKCIQKALLGKRIISPYFLLDLGSLYTHIEDYNKAKYYFLKIKDLVNENTRKVIESHLAKFSIRECNYKTPTKFIKQAIFGQWGNQPSVLLSLSLLYLLKGGPQRAIKFATESLHLSKKEKLDQHISNSYFVISSAYAALGETAKARKILRSNFYLLKKLNIRRDKNIMEILLEKKDKKTGLIKDTLLPTIEIALLIRRGNYVKAFSYARRKGLMSYLYRYIFFFPEVVIKRIERGKSTYLPKVILKLPVFNKNAFVFDVRFLGKLKVYRIWGIGIQESGSRNREKELLRLNLTPKEKAFLTHLALRLPEPGRTISLEKIYKNFWKNSKRPERNLSHLLTKIRKQLKIPVHLLEISRRGGYPVLKNNGIYFITDYLEFKETIARAKALLKANEIELAKKEFSDAFKLVRGEPFKKMYDTWSEDKRTEILIEIKNNFDLFINECLTDNKSKRIKRINLQIL